MLIFCTTLTENYTAYMARETYHTSRGGPTHGRATEHVLSSPEHSARPVRSTCGLWFVSLRLSSCKGERTECRPTVLGQRCPPSLKLRHTSGQSDSLESPVDPLHEKRSAQTTGRYAIHDSHGSAWRLPNWGRIGYSFHEKAKITHHRVVSGSIFGVDYHQGRNYEQNTQIR